ncbi:methyltransferase [Cyclobacteriaceae bacterium]|nr:methyltransferase [Cyclobacteriaceae bacterium]
MSYFNFKQFKIKHEQSFKVGTDGVLLGCWVSLDHKPQSILDIGTGSGLIALVLAQRSEAHVTGVELDEKASEEANFNRLQSPWASRLMIENVLIQEYDPAKKFDLIVSNPPYFKNSTKSGNQQKDQARHTDTLSFEDLLKQSKRLLTASGKLNVVLPTMEAEELIGLAPDQGLYLERVCRVFPKRDKAVARYLMTFGQENKTLEQTELVIQYEGRNNYTEEYIALTKAFYTIL